jgi:regulator of replication initiation timing
MNNEIKRLMEENELLKIENTMLKRKYMEDIGDDDNDCLIKRPKSEIEDYNALSLGDNIEFDSLPGDDITN